MMLMCGQSNQLWHYLAGKYPGKVGMLLGPSYFRKQAIRPWMPYALDNDAFMAYTNHTPWDEDAWNSMLTWAKRSGQRPLWILIPDVVGNRVATIEAWHRYADKTAEYGWPMAFAVQDNMTPDDVPQDASLIFVGGTTEWKWTTLPMWARSFKRVHVGRVNALRRLWTCEDFGIESVDGSGWFRDTDNGRRAHHLIQWLEGNRQDSIPLPLEYHGH